MIIVVQVVGDVTIALENNKHLELKDCLYVLESLNFKNLVELRLDYKIKMIQTNWRREYRVFTDFLTPRVLLIESMF